MNKNIDEKHINLFTIVIAVYILFYFIMNPYSLRYYFQHSLGKILLLLFIVNITMVNPIFASIFSLTIIALYNSLIFTLEGMHNMAKIDATEKKALPKEGYDNIGMHLKPAFYGSERNKIVTMETYIRPKASNALIISKYSNKNEPVAHFS